MKRRVLLALMLAAGTVSCGTAGGNVPGWDGLPAHLNGGIVVYGDSRSGDEAHRRIVAGIEHVRPAAVFHSGDLVNNGASSVDWDDFNAIAGSLTAAVPFYPAAGNHDRPGDPATLYFDQFNLPGNERWYSVAEDGIRFIVLDTTDLSDFTDTTSKQYTWLIGELQAAGADSTVAAVFHYPPYSTGRHGNTAALQDKLVPLFSAYDVDVVFTGHDHAYERSMVGGIPYVVTGGGGAPLYSRSGSSPVSSIFVKAHHFCVIYRQAGQLMVDAWNDRVELIDRFEVPVP